MSLLAFINKTQSDPPPCSPVSIGGGGASTSVATLLSRLPEDLPGDDHPLDLVGTFVDLGDLRIAHEAFDRVLADIPVTAQCLHAICSDVHRNIRCVALRDRGPVRNIFGALIYGNGCAVNGHPS